MDSNHLRLKPTDLQSAPALQLRRTPNLVKNCQKSEDATILMQASVQNVHDRNQNQADSIFHNFLVRAAGIEPAFQAWKACILAFVLCPQQIQSLGIIYHFSQNARIYYNPRPHNDTSTVIILQTMRQSWILHLPWLVLLPLSPWQSAGNIRPFHSCSMQRPNHPNL